MRRIPLAVTAGLVLTIGAPAAAHAAIVVVDGDHFAARHVSVVTQGCTDPATAPAQPPKLQITRGPLDPPAGSHSIRWTPGTDGFGTGPTVPVGDLADLLSSTVTVYSPNSYAAYVPVATYVEPDRAGLWKGVADAATDDLSGWHDVTLDALETVYTWRHYDTSGALDETEGDAMSLVNFVNDRGGNAGSARIGVIYGCDGDPVYFDAFSLETKLGTRTFDFEGYQTRTALSANKKGTVAKGAKVHLRVQLTLRSGKKALAGRVVFEQKRHGSSKFTKLATRRTGRDGVVTLTVEPSRRTAYRATYAGTRAIDSSADTVWVTVRR